MNKAVRSCLLLAVWPVALSGGTARAEGDVCNGIVDPFDPFTVRSRFFQAAGADAEMDQREFYADQGQPGCFVQKFDRWSAMRIFDSNHDALIDCIEAEAYRRNIRTRVLAIFDADADGKLTGEERAAANRALSAGQLTPVKATSRPSPASQPAEEEAAEQWLAQFDVDGDGKLNAAERATAQKAHRLQMEGYLHRWQLGRFDADADGKLSAAETKSMTARMAAWRKKFDEIEKSVMDKGDADRDGRLSAAERRAAQRVLDARHQDLLVEIFDLDGNAALDAAERGAALETHRIQVEQVRRQTQLLEYDTDGDGRLDDDERRGLELGQARRGERLDEARRAWVRKFDTDGDGKLSAAERAAMRKEDRRGELSPPEAVDDDTFREGLWEDNADESYRRRLLRLYDTDGDGWLSGEERALMWRDQYRMGMESAGGSSTKKNKSKKSSP